MRERILYALTTQDLTQRQLSRLSPGKMTQASLPSRQYASFGWCFEGSKGNGSPCLGVISILAIIALLRAVHRVNGLFSTASGRARRRGG